ncbi:MAG: sugar ABC transporter substrate-binding protein [Oscillibacter sp.]|nr:sugar ABC transporter substrate-binding protein [Oscillibacter sp.]
MNIKKILTLMCGGLLLLSLSACRGDVPANPPDAASNENITFVLSRRDEWLSALVDAASGAASEIGVNLRVVDCQYDNAKAVQYAKAAREAGEQVIILNLTDVHQAGPMIEAAGDMKVVLVNTPPDDMNRLNRNVVFVGSDESVAGRFQGEALAAYFKARSPDAERVSVRYLLFNGILGQPSTSNRTAAALQALEENGVTATEAADPMPADYDRVKAMNMMEALLVSPPEYDCVISNNDAMALGAIDALENAGLDPSEKPIVGIDCTADGAAAVADGRMLMTVYQNADGQGKSAVQAAVNLLRDLPMDTETGYQAAPDNPYVLYVPFEPVNADNVEQYR